MIGGSCPTISISAHAPWQGKRTGLRPHANPHTTPRTQGRSRAYPRAVGSPERHGSPRRVGSAPKTALAIPAGVLENRVHAER